MVAAHGPRSRCRPRPRRGSASSPSSPPPRSRTPRRARSSPPRARGSSAAADAERRRVERDLHDGAQQRLVHTLVTLKLGARRRSRPTRAGRRALVAEALEHAERAIGELRELAHGILPAVLTDGGLRAGVEALAARMPVPVDVESPRRGCRPTVEATAYFVVAEALTNVAKHARRDAGRR